MTLYDYAGSYKDLYDKLATVDDIADWQGEIDMLDEALDDKVHNVCAFVKALEAEVQAYKAEVDRLAAHRKTAENKVDYLKGLLITAIKASGRIEVKTDLFSARVQKNPPSVKVADDFDIGHSFYCMTKVIQSLDKKLMMDAMKSGIEIPGAEIVQTESVRIR